MIASNGILLWFLPVTILELVGPPAAGAREPQTAPDRMRPILARMTPNILGNIPAIDSDVRAVRAV